MALSIGVVKRGLRAGLRKSAVILSPLIRIWESSQFIYSDDSVCSPVFIVGAPRTGSTILYQALTNSYDFLYIDNLACAWNKNLRFGIWLSRKKFGANPHNNFESEFGSTRKFGGHAPSECGQFWYRWLPSDYHFIDNQDITPEMVRGIKDEVLGASAHLGRPLLFKNLNAGQRLRLIHRAFPKAKIIFVRRDPRFVVRSILSARSKLNVPPGQWWSIKPPNFSKLTILPELEMCAAQVFYLERQIETDLSLFPEENVRQVHYQDLSQKLVDDLGAWVGCPPRCDFMLPKFHRDDPMKLSALEREDLGKSIERYSFDKELFV